MKPLYTSSILTLILAVIVTACSPRLNYIGNNYTPTETVDIYFDEHDIKKEYSVMGMVKNEANIYNMDDTDSINKAMIAKAKSVGADGILYMGMYNEVYTSGENTSKVYEAKFIKYDR